jgi:hypothetical protein
MEEKRERRLLCIRLSWDGPESGVLTSAYSHVPHPILIVSPIIMKTATHSSVLRKKGK